MIGNVANVKTAMKKKMRITVCALWMVIKRGNGARTLFKLEKIREGTQKYKKNARMVVCADAVW